MYVRKEFKKGCVNNFVFRRFSLVCRFVFVRAYNFVQTAKIMITSKIKRSTP